MRHTEVWYACQMLIYELCMAYRASHPAPYRSTPIITVPWEIRK